jgi:hypothetical protein
VVNLTEAKKRAAKAYSEFVSKRTAWSKTPMLKQIDNDIWPRFKSAAHLWGVTSQCAAVGMMCFRVDLTAWRPF